MIGQRMQSGPYLPPPKPVIVAGAPPVNQGLPARVVNPTDEPSRTSTQPAVQMFSGNVDAYSSAPTAPWHRLDQKAKSGRDNESTGHKPFYDVTSSASAPVPERYENPIKGTYRPKYGL